MIYQERLFRQAHGFGCEPATILALGSLAVSAASATAQAQGQKAAATNQENQQNSLTAASNSVASDQTAALRVQQAQETEARARDQEKARLATQKARSSAVVAGGEAGITGNSLDAILSEYDLNLGQYREAGLRQGQLAGQATDAQSKAIVSGAKYQALQINAPINEPNYAAIGVGFLRDATATYRNYNPDAFKRSPTPAKTPGA